MVRGEAYLDNQEVPLTILNDNQIVNAAAADFIFSAVETREVITDSTVGHEWAGVQIIYRHQLHWSLTETLTRVDASAGDQSQPTGP